MLRRLTTQLTSAYAFTAERLPKHPLHFKIEMLLPSAHAFPTYAQTMLHSLTWVLMTHVVQKIEIQFQSPN